MKSLGYIFLLAIPFISGCFVTRTEIIQTQKDISSIKSDIGEIRQAQADIMLKLDSQQNAIQSTNENLLVINKNIATNQQTPVISQFTDNNSYKNILNKIDSLEKRVFMLWVSTSPIAFASAQELHDSAESDLAKGNTDLAVEALNKIIELYPQDELVNYSQENLANIYLSKKNDPKKALEIVTTFIINYPQNERIPNFYLIKGRAFKMLRDIPNSLKAFQYVVSKFPTSEEAKIARGELDSLYPSQT